MKRLTIIYFILLIFANIGCENDLNIIPMCTDEQGNNFQDKDFFNKLWIPNNDLFVTMQFNLEDNDIILLRDGIKVDATIKRLENCNELNITDNKNNITGKLTIVYLHQNELILRAQGIETSFKNE